MAKQAPTPTNSEDSLSDLAESLGAEADAAEAAEQAEFEARAKGEPLGAATEDTPKPEGKDKEEEEEEEEEEKPSLDFGDEEEDLDIDLDTPSATDADEADEDDEEEDEEDDEEDEDDEDEEDDDGLEDPDEWAKKAMEEFEGMEKASDVRKYAAKQKAEAAVMRRKVKAMESKVKEARKEADEAYEKYLDRSTNPNESLNISDYKPYADIAKEYSDWRIRAARSIKSAKVRSLLEQKESDFRTRAARIEGLSGDDYDTARSDLEKDIKDTFGDHSDKVLSIVDQAAEYEIRAAETRAEFNKEKSTNAVAWARKQYDEKEKELDSTLSRLFRAPDEKNPFSVDTAVHNLLKDPEQGDKAEEITKRDYKLAMLAINGPPPFEPDPTWDASELAAAKQSHVEQVENLEKFRKDQLPIILARGRWATRLVQILGKRVYELEGGKKKSPAPTKRRAKKGKKAPSEDPAETAAEVDRAIANLGE